jgi:arylsulfatase A-like enzyme
MKRPNILIIATDQQRADCVGCAGHPQIKTPNIDRIAGQGVRFAQATTVSPLCMPARASFISGLYPHNHGMWKNSGELPASDETFFHHLQSHGYLTAHIGKSHYYVYTEGLHVRQKLAYMHARGLEYIHESAGPRSAVKTESGMTDEWREKGLLDLYKKDYAERKELPPWIVRPSPLPVEDFTDSYPGRKAVEFVRTYQDERPMCLFVGFHGPHEPWDAPAEYATMYRPEETPPPIPIAQGNSNLPTYVKQKVDFKPREGMAIEDVQHLRANYYGKISLIDYWVGEILSAFEDRGWLDDLFIVFWSDHGEMAGDHGMLFKRVFYESSVRIPLILRWPGEIPQSVVSDALVENIDVFPTILEAIKARPSRRCLGRSLWPVMHDPELEHRLCALSEVFHAGSKNVMVRTHRHKYAVDDKGRGLMLYDLENDPHEQDNLIGRKEALNLEEGLRDLLLRQLLETQYVME